jgi:tyrosinase
MLYLLPQGHTVRALGGSLSNDGFQRSAGRDESVKTNSEPRIRRSIGELQNDYVKGTKKPLEDLMRAWKGIKELPPDDPRSFFVLGGYHGEPFRGAGWGNSAYWGGYCNHGNILFPTWHRVYLLKLEQALQSMPGCRDVMLPFWDETGEASLKDGVPWALTKKDFELDGQTIANPLRSFVFNKGIVDHLSPVPDADYSKPKGYETVRYPLSGLVGPNDKAATDKHNAQFPDYDANVKLLSQNVAAWLSSLIVIGGKPFSSNVADKYRACLDAPNYTAFSNTTSAQQWREDGDVHVMSLESPHNSIHLAVGGFDLPGQGDQSPIDGANADMGENDTAGLDPIFFFHHCFVDRVFWLWQKRHGFTEHLEIIPEYPGTNTVDLQGPTPGTAPNAWLTLESPLNPFRKGEGDNERPYTSLDCVDIEKQLGYSYASGSLEGRIESPALSETYGDRVVRVAGINRARVRGSFLVSAYVSIGGKELCIGAEAVLSRWNVQGCANCQTHLETKAFFPLPPLAGETVAKPNVKVKVRTRDGFLDRQRPIDLVGKKTFFFEVR